MEIDYSKPDWVMKKCLALKKKEPEPLKCIACGTTNQVEMECARTRYYWDGLGKDPNIPIPLCRPCAETRHEDWDERWKEYYNGLL